MNLGIYPSCRQLARPVMRIDGRTAAEGNCEPHQCRPTSASPRIRWTRQSDRKVPVVIHGSCRKGSRRRCRHVAGGLCCPRASKETALRSLIFRLLAATWAVSLVAPASGAEIRHTRREEMLATNFTNVIMEGKIETGDYDKLLKLIDEDCRDYSCINGIYLASPAAT